MAATPTAITSYSAEVGLVARKPQFNGDPASLFGADAVAPERFYMDGGALVQEPAAAEVVPPVAVPAPAPAPVPAPAVTEPAA